jgi:3-oxoacyl-[acyl-carrier-protein] synthase III
MKSYIKAVSYYLPDNILDNEQLKREFPLWDMDESYRITGVRERHIALPGQTPSDLAFHAAEQLFNETGFDRNKIDFLILCTQSNDYISPTTASVLQDRLGLAQHTGTIDINQGCSGFVYSLGVAKGLVEAGIVKNVLLLTAETISRYIYPSDMSTRPLFGDGASASVISGDKSEKSFSIGDFIFGTNGKGFRNIIVEYYGARNPQPAEVFESTDQYGNIRRNDSFFMNGSAVFLFSIKTAPMLIKQLLEKSGLLLPEINLFIFHQASRLIVETIAERTGIPPDKNYICLENFGNTVSSTIPIALVNASREGKIKNGDKIMLVSFGVGYAWAGTIITYQSN